MPAGGPGPGDGLARAVLDQVASEREHLPPRDWLLFLARTAAADVAARLEQAGYLTRGPRGGPGSGARWVPVDPDCAFAPLARVKAALHLVRPARLRRRGRWPGWPPPAGWATSWRCTCRRGARAPSDAAVWQLDPGLRELIAQTQAAVDSAVLAHRV